MTLLELVFWGALGTVFYVYLGFPVLVTAWGWLHPRPVRKKPWTPSISLIIAAYNEEHNIQARLDNALESDYPEDRLEIVVASDGSNDATEVLTTQYVPRVRLLCLRRRGKIFALREAARTAQGEILVFSDANTFFATHTLRKLVESLADREVGGVVGNKIYRTDSRAKSVASGEKLYWWYDKWLKSRETVTGCAVSADGAAYAIRKQLFKFPEDPAVTDNFAISTAVIEQGYRLVFEKNAPVFERTLNKATQEFSRKVCLMTRGLRGVLLRKGLLNPFRHGFYSVVLFSHKVLRRFVPILLLAILFSSLGLFGYRPVYSAALAAQSVFLGLAVLGQALRSTAIGQLKLLLIPFYYCLSNAAALLAILNLLRGERIERWQPQRLNEVQALSSPLETAKEWELRNNGG